MTFREPIYQIRYEFESAGQIHFQTDAVNEAEYKRTQVGRIIPGRAAHLLGEDYCYTGLALHNQMQSQAVMIGVVWIVGGIVAIRSITAKLRIRRILHTGPAAIGTIVYKASRPGRSTAYYVTFRFETIAGISYTVKNKVSRDGYDRVGQGSDVTVIYDPRRPQRCVAYECCAYEIG
jgi:hypothetical protein